MRAGKRIDVLLALAIFLLVVFGVIMISSASVVISYEKFGNNYHYVLKQLQYLGLGIIAWFFMTIIDYHFWRQHAVKLMILAIILLIAVFIPGIGRGLLGASRWIHIGPLFFQPSEITKLAVIIYMAAWLEKRGDGVKDLAYGFIPFSVIIGFIILLIMLEPDMGTATIIALATVTMFFVSGARISHLVSGAIVAGLAFWGLVQASPYRLRRLTAFLNPENDTLGIAYHINQAMLAIGTGGLLGLGFGQSKQKYLYLPEPATDSIFAITVEELGFIRSIVVIALFIFIAYRGYNIAQKAPDQFGRFLAIGITSWIVLQAFINIAAMLSLIPLTGVPIPFVSSGGSSLIFTLAAVGILLNISKYTRDKAVRYGNN